MHQILSDHWHRIIARRLLPRKSRTAAVTWNYYVLGTLAVERDGHMHLWARVDDGIFAVEIGGDDRSPGSVIGFLLIVRGILRMVFTRDRVPLDCPGWSGASSQRPPFYLDTVSFAR